MNDNPLDPVTEVIQIECGWRAPVVLLAKYLKTCVTAYDIDVAVRQIIDFYCGINKCMIIFQNTHFIFINEKPLYLY
ncbi:MAG: hypothetical protein CBC09_06705 [Cellvibrionales bacterium TMED49]|nr:hypothetical protein [Porticoccaceae bacterium]OUU37716.1 MAG: hypothetical protein CBC09_06705 [Cellvibrionales bacterium TMED49]|tara:strand:+ start:988 stop:1218 length:231 start_codon:yes stop_codon:yes gene_type:complete